MFSTAATFQFIHPYQIDRFKHPKKYKLLGEFYNKIQFQSDYR